jgi:hypothetical protein
MAEPTPPLQGAADRIRETAKWLTVSLGALGTVLVAGSQLSSLGALDPSSGRFVAAIVGAAIAGLGAAAILAATAVTATTPAVSLSTLGPGTPKGVDDVLSDPTLLQGHSSAAELKTDYETALETRAGAFRAYYASPTDSALRSAAETADANAVQLHTLATGLVGAASYANLAYRWRRAAIAVGIGALLAAGGLGCFAWAANPPEDAKASAAAANVLTSPKMQYMQLNERGRTVLRDELGDDCDTTQPVQVLVLASTAAGPDLLVDEPDCKAVRLVLTSDWGTVADTR